MKKPRPAPNSAQPGFEGLFGWDTRVLPKLNDKQVRAIKDMLKAWYWERPWNPPQGVDWRELWGHLDRMGLDGILGAMALEGRVSPPDLAQTAMHINLGNGLYNEKASRVCRRLARAAREAGAGLVLMKGPALNRQAYKDPGARSYSDLDLFAASKDQAHELLAALGLKEVNAWSSQPLGERLSECECLNARLDGWDLEIRYPLAYPGEPMFEFLLEHKERLMPPPQSGQAILDPDPSLHMVFLILHMSIHHVFTRLLWLMDLAALYKSQKDRLDMDLVQGELVRLGLANAGHAATSWCRRNLDPDFPVIKPLLPAWNLQLMRRMTSTGDILAGRFQIYHHGWWQPLWKASFGMLSFYLVADPAPGSNWFKSFGTKWTLTRFRTAFKFEKPIRALDMIFSFLITLVCLPPARLLARIMGRPPRS